MSEFYKYLYRTDNISPVQMDYLKQCIDEGRLPINFYAIALSLPSQDRVTIYPSLEWNSSRVDRENSQVIGIARTYYGSKYLIQQLVKDCYNATKNVNLSEYLKLMDPNVFQKEDL